MISITLKFGLDNEPSTLSWFSHEVPRVGDDIDIDDTYLDVKVAGVLRVATVTWHANIGGFQSVTLECDNVDPDTGRWIVP
jgi:hypothetical protein